MNWTITDQRSRTFQAVVAWIVTVLTAGYMLPWAVAATRGKSNTAAVFWINLLTGWTVIGFVVALVMSLGPHKVYGVRY